MNAIRNWKTTLSGVLTVLFTVLAIWHDPAKAADPAAVGVIIGGIGLIVAKDGNKTGTAEPPKV